MHAHLILDKTKVMLHLAGVVFAPVPKSLLGTGSVANHFAFVPLVTALPVNVEIRANRKYFTVSRLRCLDGGTAAQLWR